MFWEMCFLNVLLHGILHSFVWQGYSGFAIMDYAQGYQDIKESSKGVYVCQMRVNLLRKTECMAHHYTDKDKKYWLPCS